MYVLNLRLGLKALHKLEPPLVLLAHTSQVMVTTVCYFDKRVFCSWILVLIWVIFTAKALVGLSYVLLRGVFGHWK